MKIRMSACIVLFVSLFLASSVLAASPKIGYFSLQTVLSKSKWGQQVEAQLKGQQQKLKGEVDRKVNEFKGLKEEYDKKKAVLDEGARTKKAKELVEKQQEAEKTLMESNASINKLRNDLARPLLDKLKEIVEKLGKDDKYDYILEVQESGIAYASSNDDITDKVIKELDKVTPRK